MKRGGWVNTVGATITTIVGFEVLTAILRPDLSTVLLIAAGSTVLTGIVLWFFFRSLRANDRSRGDVGDRDVQRVAVETPFDAEAEPCVLASAACTSGWLDWIHGELWVCSDGLLRRSLGLRKTIEHGSNATVNPGLRPKRRFTAAERYVIGNEREMNRWIAWDWIDTAEVRRGTLTDSFHYRLKVGSRGKLLWPRADGAVSLIEGTARSHLGDRFSGT